jgi:aspartyl-tRNA(Asn)/glutamyl-tRNA(Gln) amidotransferase subunit C
VGVTAEELRRVAELAALAIEEDEIVGLTAQLNGILEHMRALDEAAAALVVDLDGVADCAGATPLRPDEPGADPLAEPLASMAPGWDQDFFTVPQLASHGGTETPPDAAAGRGA